MFITYKINDDLYLPAELYTLNTTKAVRDAIFAKYLYKITRYGVCVRIKSIEIVDNLILRREADLLVKVAVEIVVIKLNTNEYF
jgi:DNA-directed RNA polymerase subunit E'/Rpb7